MGILDRITGQFETVEEFAQALALGIQEDINASVNPLLQQLDQVKLQLPSGSLVPSLSGSIRIPTPSPSAILPPINILLQVDYNSGGNIAAAQIAAGIVRPSAAAGDIRIRYPETTTLTARPGSSITLTASPTANFPFVGWFPGGERGDGFQLSREPTFTYTVPSENITITALYAYTNV